jgi:DNA-binding winged helix-turn-helix (wHTH) protein
LLLAFDEFVLDPQRRELRRNDEPLKVDALVLDLLAYLASRPDELVTHDALIAEVWGGRAVADNVVSVCMAKLRKALGHRRGDREFVINVYGRGYRFVRPVRRLPHGSQPPPAPGSDSPALPARPFVGRTLPMARLQAGLGEAIQGRGQLYALLGEPGIGKTRLAETLEAQAVARGAHVAWGRSRDLAGSPPLWPWVQVVREVLAVVTVGEARLRLGESFGELSRLLPELGAAADATLDASSARHRTSDAVCRLLAVAAERSAWVVVLDDLQRADAASLGLLAYLVDELARMRVLVVCTVRSTEPELAAAQQRLLDYALGHRNAERIELARLSAAEVADYTAAVLGQPDQELAGQVFARSEGNPFFMTELLREASLGLGDAPQLSALSGVALELPRQRVRSLGPEALGVLQHAAVIGRSFELPLLAASTGLPASRVLEQLEEALAMDVVVTAPGELGHFAFDHDLLREVLLDGLTPSELAASHLRVAEALEAQSGSGLPVAAAALAYHRLRGLPQGDPELAARAAERAAMEAMQAAAFADAAALIRHALGALDLAAAPAHATRARLQYALGLCLRSFDAPASIEALRQAVRIARAHGLYDTLARCGLALVGAPGVVMLADGRSVLEDALAGLPAGEHALRALALCHLSWCAPLCFERERCQTLVAEASRHAEQSDSEQARFIALRARIHLQAGPCVPYQGTLDLIAQADVAARNVGPIAEGLWRMQRRTLLAVLASQRGDRLALEQILTGLSDTDRAHFPELGWHCERMVVIDRLNRAELADMGARLTELRQRAERLQLFAHERVCAYDTMIWLSLTHPDWARIRAASPVLAAVPEDPPSVLAIKLRSALCLGQLEGARAIVSDFAAHGFEKLPCDRDYLSVLGYVAQAVSVLGDATHAAGLLDLLEPFADRAATDMSMHTAGSVAHLLGLLCRLLGRRAEARTYFERAVGANEAFGLRVHALDSRTELAAELLAAGAAAGRARAAQLVEEVTAAGGELGLPGHVARAQALALRE